MAVVNTSSSPSSASFWSVEEEVVEPSVMSSKAFRTPLSKARASAGLWNVKPHFLLSTFQW